MNPETVWSSNQTSFFLVQKKRLGVFSLWFFWSAFCWAKNGWISTRMVRGETIMFWFAHLTIQSHYCPKAICIPGYASCIVYWSIDLSIYWFCYLRVWQMMNSSNLKLPRKSLTKTMIQQVFSDGMIWSTLPETNSEFTPENRPKPKMKFHLNLPSISRG